tara:strand:+ start:129 stop:1148 length:1020 start_codon:yes stop_codon:yes gene_type:complete
MNYLFFLSIIIINEIFIKFDILLDKIEFSKHKSFITTKKIPTSGGILALLFILFFYKNLSIINLVIIILIFLIGFLSDKIRNFSPTLRLLSQIILTFFFITNSNILINDVRINEINLIIENYKSVSIIFTIFCFIVFINGINFVDGTNLNAIGYLILVYLSIFIISKMNNLLFDSDFLSKIILFLFVIYILNFFNRLQLGDSGSYILGFFTAYYIINFISNNNLVSPYFAVYILWYPCFENLFSIVRKINQKKSISEADNLHLHHYIFLFFKSKNYKNINNLTGIILNSFNLILMILGLFYFSTTKILVFIIALNIICYLILYNYLGKKLLKKPINNVK